MGMSLRRSGYLRGRGGCEWDGVQAGTKKVLLGQTVMCPKATTYVLVLSHGGSGEPLEVWGRGSASEQRPWGLALSISLAKSRSLRQASAGAFDPAQIGGRISAASPSLQGPKVKGQRRCKGLAIRIREGGDLTGQSGRSCACNAERDHQMPLWRSARGPEPRPSGESHPRGGEGRTTEGRRGLLRRRAELWPTAPATSGAFTPLLAS